MQTKNSTKQLFRINRHTLIGLCVCWFTGLTLGCLFVSCNSEVVYPLIRGLQKVQFCGTRAFLFSTLFLLCMYLVLLWGSLVLSCSLIIVKAFVYGLLSCSLFCFFGPAGLLVHFLLMFSDAVTITAFFCLIFHSFSTGLRVADGGVRLLFFFAGLLCVIQTAFISPFYFKLVNLL